MTRAVAAPRSSRSGSTTAPSVSLADIKRTGSGLPNRYIIHGCEGSGKTSLAAFATANAKNPPVFIQTLGETGLETLIDAGQLPEIPHFPEVQDWSGLLEAIQVLIDEDHDHPTLVIDTLNGAERLCHEFVCKRDFSGDWGERGFGGYQRGYEVSLAEWRNLLNALDELRSKKRMAIVCLCHTKVSPFRNPEGADYDRYSPDMHHKTWSLSHKWSDAVFFLNFETFVDEKNPKKKGKATSNQTRWLYTTRHAAYDAKNRLGLPDEIEMGSSGKESWDNFVEALKQARLT